MDELIFQLQQRQETLRQLLEQIYSLVSQYRRKLTVTTDPRQKMMISRILLRDLNELSNQFENEFSQLDQEIRTRQERTVDYTKLLPPERLAERNRLIDGLREYYGLLSEYDWIRLVTTDPIERFRVNVEQEDLYWYIVFYKAQLERLDKSF